MCKDMITSSTGAEWARHDVTVHQVARLEYRRVIAGSCLIRASRIWPEHDERRERLYAAARMVAADPPQLVAGDLMNRSRCENATPQTEGKEPK